MFKSKKRLGELEEEVATLKAAVLNLQNLTRILERDICNCSKIKVAREAVRNGALKAKSDAPSTPQN